MPRLVALPGGRTPTRQKHQAAQLTTPEKAFIDKAEKIAVTIDTARGELWDGIAAQDYELTLRAGMRLLACALVMRDEAGKVPHPNAPKGA